MYLILLTLPFLGSAISGLRGRTLGSTGSQIVSTLCIITSAILSLIAFYEVALSRSPVSIDVGQWMVLGVMDIRWGFQFDDLTVAILLPVFCVSSAVHVYSTSYIADDPHTPRFFSYLSLFTGSMGVLVAADSYALMFVGWELIGVASYLLIGFWLTRAMAQKAAVKAMCVNRVGDTLLSLGFFAALWVIGSLDYATVLSVSPLLNETVLTLIGLLFLGGAMSKSAQLPLHTWLADAIEGPTPVSALIHAATLVTAGVYLMLRSSHIMEYGPVTLIVTAWLGAATAFFAATCGVLVSDLKRVIAYSTCSQLGYMIMALGLSQYHVSIYHLVTHACFKALLFLAAGSVIHAIADQQDLRRVGGLGPFLPFTYVAMLVGSLSLMALPGLTGFYSKDHILELAAGAYTLSGHVVYWIGTISAGLTAYYSFRLLILVFFSNPNGPRQSYSSTHEAPFLLGAPLVFLAILSIFFGFMAKDLWLGIGTDYLSHSLSQHPNHVVLVEAEFAVPVIIKMLPLTVTLFGAMTAIIIYNFNITFALSLTEVPLGRRVFSFINGQWRWNALVTGLVIKPFMNLGLIVSKNLDRGIVEYVGPQGLSTLLKSTGVRIAQFDTSVVTTYALYIVIGFISLVLVLLAPYVLPGIVLSSDVSLFIIFILGLGLIQSSNQKNS